MLVQTALNEVSLMIFDRDWSAIVDGGMLAGCLRQPPSHFNCQEFHCCLTAHVAVHYVNGLHVLVSLNDFCSTAGFIVFFKTDSTNRGKEVPVFGSRNSLFFDPSHLDR